MTKKPSEKNKAWEKERRDRLNKSFDSLAKLLPNYDPSVVWTKIEIIQKSILYIEVLQQRNKKYLATKDPQELKKYNELIDAIKYFQSRNGQLSEILKKSKIALPPFTLPKYLCDNTTLIENNQKDQLNLNEDQFEKSIKEIDEKSNELNLEKNVKDEVSNCNNKNKLKTSKIKSFKQQTTKIDKTKSKNVRIVTVTSTVKPDIVLTSEEKLENDIKLPAKNEPNDKNASTNQSNIQLPNNSPVPSTIFPAILPTLIKIENLPVNKKIKKSNPNQIIRKIAKDQNGKIKILPQPHLKLYYRRADGKMPIPVIRKKIIVPIKKRQPRKRKIINNDEQCGDAKKIRIKEENKHIESDKTEKVNDENYVVGVTSPTVLEKKNVDLKISNLNLLEVVKNSGTISPTAAFLESFPVVASTTIIGKLCETQNIEQIDVIPKISEINKTSDSNVDNLENLNNFFATNEYSNYCAQTKDNIIQDSIKLDNKQLEKEETKIDLKPPEIKILENIKIEAANKMGIYKQIIKNDLPIVETTTNLNEKLTISTIIPVTTTNISNSVFTAYPPITINPLILSPTSISLAPSTLNLINCISTPSTIFSSSTQFMSNYPNFPNSIVRQPNIKRNSCKFNLSTKGPICTPLPLDSKNFISQNYSTPTNCRYTSSNIPRTLPQISLDNFNISKTGSSDVNYNSPVVTTSNLISSTILSVQNIPSQTFINNSAAIMTSQNNITNPILPYNTVNADLESNKSLSLAANTKNMANFQNYQTSFENFNLKTYAAATNITPETLKTSVEKTSKISKNSTLINNNVNNKIPSTTANNTNMVDGYNSAKLYPSTLSQNFVNINSSFNQIYSSNLIQKTSSSDITPNSNTNTIKAPIISVSVNDKNLESNLNVNLSKFNPYSTTPISIYSNSVNNTSIQSDKIDVKYTLNNFIPPVITSIVSSSLTNFNSNVKTQSTKFHPYAASFGIPIATTTNQISTNPIPTYSTNPRIISNYPTKTVSLNNPTIVNYTTANFITSKSSETDKVINSKLHSQFLNTKTTEYANYHTFNSTLPPNIIPSSTNTTNTTSEIVLRPYDFVSNSTTNTTRTSNYLSSLPYNPTTKQMILPTTDISSVGNYSHTSFTNLTTINNNNNNTYSMGNSVYSNPSKNYYYPLQTESSTTFSFSLTTTTNSQTTPLVTPQTQSILTYPNFKTEMPPPWIPQPSRTPASVTTDYKTPFTFSLTPTTTVASTTSLCIINSTQPSNHLITNQQVNSYNSTTNFTFCLTTPKSTPPVEASTHKPITTNLTTKHYPIYNTTTIDSQLNLNQKDTTNFTFALTKPTNSIADITPTATIISNNNKFENIYTSNSENKNNQDIIKQNTTSVAVPPFKITSNKGKGPKINKKNITQISTNDQNYYDCEQNKSCAKVSQKSHVNWMTSTAENTSISKITQPSYLPTQNNENIIPWPPNKIYDNNLQQTYCGETNHYTEYPINSNNPKFYNVKNEKYINTNSPASSTTNNQSNNSNNFFSVSQLVDQSSVSSKNFTNVPNFNQTSCQHNKITPIKSAITKDMKIENQATNNLLNIDYSEPQQQREQKPLTISNTYSAEALISKKEKHRNFNPTNCNNNNNNNLINSTDFYNNTIDQLETIIPDQNNYHTNNYFYNYHHQQSINHHQNYTIQSEIDYLGGSSYENDDYNKTILNKIDKKLYPPPPITLAPSPVPPLSTSNNPTNVTTFLPYDTNYSHYHGSTSIPITSSSSTNNNNNNNYHHANNWTKGLHYTNCVVPQYHHNQQILTPIIGDHGQGAINSQTVSGNLTNFNLSSICPEINDKVNSSGTNNEW